MLAKMCVTEFSTQTLFSLPLHNMFMKLKVLARGSFFQRSPLVRKQHLPINLSLNGFLMYSKHVTNKTEQHQKKCVPPPI